MNKVTIPPELGDHLLRRLVAIAYDELRRVGLLGREDPVDLAADVWIEVFKVHVSGRLDREPSQLGAFIRVVANRRAIDRVRKASREVKTVPAPHSEQALVGSVSALDALVQRAATSTSTRLRRLDAKERALRVLDFVARLGQPEYELFVLRHADELSYEEIARLRGKTVPAVKFKLHRIHERIRSEFPHYSTPPAGGE